MTKLSKSTTTKKYSFIVTCLCKDIIIFTEGFEGGHYSFIKREICTIKFIALVSLPDAHLLRHPFANTPHSIITLITE